MTTDNDDNIKSELKDVILDLFDQVREANLTHTLTATCHAKAISRLKYLKAFYHELVKGRKDYESHLASAESSGTFELCRAWGDT